MRKKDLAILVVIIIIALTGCDRLFGKSPSKVVQNFYKLAEEGELSGAHELVSQRGKQILAMAGGAQAIGGLTNEIMKKGGIKNFRIVKEDITGEMATVNFELTFGDGSVKKDNEKLIKENGEWKIVFSK